MCVCVCVCFNSSKLVCWQGLKILPELYHALCIGFPVQLAPRTPVVTVIPSLLPSLPPANAASMWSLSSKGQCTFRLVRADFVPPGLFEKLLAKCASFCKR